MFQDEGRGARGEGRGARGEGRGARGERMKIYLPLLPLPPLLV